MAKETNREKYIKASVGFERSMILNGLITVATAILAVASGIIIRTLTTDIPPTLSPFLLFLIPIGLFIKLSVEQKKLGNLYTSAQEELRIETNLRTAAAMLKDMPEEFRNKTLEKHPELRQYIKD